MSSDSSAESPANVRRHPWNTNFSWRSPEEPFRVLDSDQAAQFDRDGYVVLDSVLDPELVEEVTSEIDRSEAEAEARLRERNDEREGIAEAGALTFTPHLVARSALLRSFAAHPLFLGLCADLVGPDVNMYWDQAVYKKPEKPRRFPWHQDNGYAYVEPQQYLTCWVALTDATVENGCPWVVPGLHRMGTIRHRYVDPLGWECFEDPEEARQAPVSAGGVVVFSSLTPHLTGPNTTDQVRKAYILQYVPSDACLWWGNPKEGPPTAQLPCDDPDRQFPVLRGGRPSNAGERMAR
jgi:phytanoyl-CoA hydroxylase